MGFNSREKKLHAVCVPCPLQGHIRPMLKLAQILHSTHDFHITFVNTEYNHRRLLRSRGSQSLDGIPSFQFKAIPDGLSCSDGNVSQDIPTLVGAVMSHLLEPFKKLLISLGDESCSESGPPPVTLIISDLLMPFTHDVAHHLNLPLVLLWTASACGFAGYSQYPSLLNKEIIPFQDSSFETDGSLDMVVDCVPNSIKGISLKYIPSFIRTTDKEDIMLNFLMLSVERAAHSGAPVIFNSFDAFEHDVLHDISKIIQGPVYTIGPFQLQLKNIPQESQVTSLGSNLWIEDPECIKWLDSREPSSVIYVSFGSITTMTHDNLIEFAWGLANSNHPFLWIVRPDIVSGDAAIIPPEFLAETEDRGMLASWCDQETVLSHASVGAFLTHCGWNSMLDTVCAGVPVLCWPFFAEQQTNCWFSFEKWGIGMEIDNVVRRDGVEKQVRELMEGEKGIEMRMKAMDWKRLAEEATTSPKGSSLLSLDMLFNQVLLPLKKGHTN